MPTDYQFDWSELAFGSKKPLKALNAVFIAAPREMSIQRFTQLVKEYLPKHTIVLGIAKEAFIEGFDGQPQFRTLQLNAALQQVINKVNTSPSAHKIYTLHYFQREARYIFEKGGFSTVLLVNGSWQYTFHNRPEYYVLANNHIDYKLISPFANETEARAYDTAIAHEMQQAFLSTAPTGVLDEAGMLALAGSAAKFSLDYTFQTGVALGKRHGSSHSFTHLTHSFNKVVPFQTYALHHGSVREANFSPVNDLNHYDTVHAEVMLLVRANQQNIDLRDTTVFINLLPCPNCARMFTQTDVAEFIYTEDHSAGYAIRMLEAAGKKVRRVVPPAAV